MKDMLAADVVPGCASARLTYADGTSRTVLYSTEEVPFPEGRLIVSCTDLQGVITAANQSFVDMSGYAREELMGAPHYILRHPDMPAVAFKGCGTRSRPATSGTATSRTCAATAATTGCSRPSFRTCARGASSATPRCGANRRARRSASVKRCTPGFCEHAMEHPTTFNFTVSPDFAPDRISGWFIFNTWLQKEIGQHIHLELHGDFATQRRDIAAGKIDLIYANPSDASLLVREQGFVGVARPAALADEAVVVVPEGSPVPRIEDLAPGARIAATDHPDVRMMGMIMLEPADLSAANTTTRACETYVLVAKALLNGDADVGFFLKRVYDDMSAMIRKGLRPLVTSQIYVVRHGLLAGPRLAGQRQAILDALLRMSSTAKGRDVLANLGFTSWEEFAEEDVEFMIDLIDTLAA